MDKTILLFPGQGSQYPGMGKSLYDNFKVVKELYEEACDSLCFDIIKLSFNGPEDELTLTKNTQPAILTHSISVLRVLSEETSILENKKQLVAAGHSLGEFSALVASEALSFYDAVKLVSLRGEYMQTACAEGIGAMSAIIGIESDKVSQVCKDLSENDSFVVPANLIPLHKRIS